MELWGVRSSLIRGKGAAWRRATGCMFAVTALALSGCSDQPAPPPTQTVQQTAAQPAATNTPMFASDEEALAAGVAAYQRMLDTQMRVLGGDRSAVSEYPSVMEGEYLELLTDEAQKFSEQGYVAYGSPQTRDARLQSVKSGSKTSVVFYICLDMNNVKFKDSQGQPVKETTKPRNYTMVVTTNGTMEQLKVSRVEKWSDTPC